MKARSSMTAKSPKVQLLNCYKPEQMEQLKEIFKMYDRDNSGRITSRTLKFLLRGLGDNVREEEIDCKLRAMDIDGSSSIDFSEFLQYMLEKANRQNLYSDILEIFKLFDGSQTGYLSKIEIKNITRGMLEDRTIEEFCRAADPHGEGEVNYTAFLDRLLK